MLDDAELKFQEELRFQQQMRSQWSERKSGRPDTSRIERDWRTWYSAIFGEQFVSVLAPHHVEAIEWHWEARHAQKRGEKPQYLADFEIWPRGHLKSTLARRIAVCDAAIGGLGYCLYGSGTKKKVKGHSISIETLLRSDAVRRYYPKLSEVRRNEQGASKGWTADFLNTEYGYVFHFVGLDEGVAGANIEDVRPTLLVADDIDDREDSPVISETRLHVFTRSFLPTRQANSLVLVAQNLIAEHTAVNQIFSGSVRALTNRRPTQPVPAIRNMATEPREVDGIVKDVILAGEPTWAFYDLARAQEEIDTIGLDSFEAECNHEIDKNKGGLIMSMFDEAVHLITLSQFRQRFGCDPFPAHWHQRHTHDVGYTGEKAHPGVFFFLGVASANSPMPGKLFIAPEIFLGGQNESPDHAAERYLERVIGHPKLTTDPGYPDRRWTPEQLDLAGKLYRQYRANRPHLVCRMSHEALGTRRVFMKYGMAFHECNPGADGGIQQMQHYHKVDYSKPHDFHEGRMGVSNIYWVVADNQLEKAKNEWGMARGRLEMKRWRWHPSKLTETGLSKMKPMKVFDDFSNGFMMAVHDMAMHVVELTSREREEKALPAGWREENLTAANWDSVIVEREAALNEFRRKEQERFRSPIAHGEDVWTNADLEAI